MSAAVAVDRTEPEVCERAAVRRSSRLLAAVLGVWGILTLVATLASVNLAGMDASLLAPLQLNWPYFGHLDQYMLVTAYWMAAVGAWLLLAAVIRSRPTLPFLAGAGAGVFFIAMTFWWMEQWYSYLSPLEVVHYSFIGMYPEGGGTFVSVPLVAVVVWTVLCTVGAVVALRKPRPQPAEAEEAIPAGWYPDADSGSLQRFWDGHDWTQQTRLVPPAGGTAAAPGWYPDPEGRPVDRHWDGETWGERTRPVRPQTQPARGPSNMMAATSTIYATRRLLRRAALLHALQDQDEQ